jgi:hypothetical protein
MKSRSDRAKKTSFSLPPVAQGQPAISRDNAPQTTPSQKLKEDTAWAKADWFQQWERVARGEV